MSDTGVDKEAKEAVSLFVGAQDLRSLREAVVDLQRRKLLASAARDPVFMERVHNLQTPATSSGQASLEALALLFRIAAVAKVLRPSIEAIASAVDVCPEALPQSLSDPDDRRYVGEALKFASGAWKKDYLARAIVHEASGEEARISFIVALLEMSTIMDSLLALSEAFKSWSVATQDVGSSRAKRLIRVAAGLKTVIVEKDPEAGDGVGPALSNLMQSAIQGEVLDRSMQGHLASAILDLLSSTVRFHFSIASEAETFAVVGLLNRWFRDRSWPREAERAQEAVKKQVIEALVFLAKQGIGDNTLRKTLILLLGEDEACAELVRVGNESKGIPNELREWLISGRHVRLQATTKEAVDESILRTLDRDLAALLRDGTDLGAVLDRIQDDVIPAVESYEPKLAPSAERLLSLIRTIGYRVKNLAERRSLRFGSRSGDVVDFNPVDHEPPIDGLITRRVRIKSPSVQRCVDGVPPGVILKAEVENCD